MSLTMRDNAGPDDVYIQLTWAHRSHHEDDGSDLVPHIEIEDGRSGLVILDVELTPVQFHKFMGGRQVHVTPAQRVRPDRMAALGKYMHHRSALIPPDAVGQWDRDGRDAALAWAQANADRPEDASLSVTHLRDGWQWLARWYRDEPMVRS